MCKILNEYTESKTFTGYKVVLVDKHGHYHSPYTGVRYEKGKVKAHDCKSKLKYIIADRFDEIIPDNTYTYFNPQMKGYTGVITQIEDARSFLRYCYDTGKYTCKIIKMTISGDLHCGEFGCRQTIVGTHIDKITNRTEF